MNAQLTAIQQILTTKHIKHNKFNLVLLPATTLGQMMRAYSIIPEQKLKRHRHP